MLLVVFPCSVSRNDRQFVLDFSDMTVVRILVHSLTQKVSALSVVGSVPGAGDNTVNKTKVLL